MPEGEINNANNMPGTAPAPPSSVVSPGASTPPVSSQPPSGQPKKSKKPLLIAVIILAVLLAAGAVYWFALRDSNDTPAPNTNSTGTESQTPLATALSEIDAKNDKYEPTVKDGSYLFMVDSKSYSVTEGEYKGSYNLGDSTLDRIKALSSEECTGAGSNQSTIKPKLDAAAKAFTDAGFTAEEGKFPSYQHLNCQIGYTVTNETDSCSLSMGIVTSAPVTSKDAKDIWSMNIGCVTAEKAKEDKALAVAFLEIDKDVITTPSKLETRFIKVPDYIKDSATPGYKIAQIDSESLTKLRYFKKGADKWVAVYLYSPQTSTYGTYGKCSVYAADATLKAAFKGEPCSNEGDSEGTI